MFIGKLLDGAIWLARAQPLSWEPVMPPVWSGRSN